MVAVLVHEIVVHPLNVRDSDRITSSVAVEHFENQFSFSDVRVSIRIDRLHCQRIITVTIALTSKAGFIPCKSFGLSHSRSEGQVVARFRRGFFLLHWR
jgi:phosphatidylserine/phosphatidylglycerophosphate/cardiolipin synthase-like enzyme